VDVAAASWDPVALRTEELNDEDTVLSLKKLEAGQCPERKYITDRSLIYTMLLGPM
jgi:hypothetical protein